jgi:hypothetical protein
VRVLYRYHFFGPIIILLSASGDEETRTILSKNPDLSRILDYP